MTILLNQQRLRLMALTLGTPFALPPGRQPEQHWAEDSRTGETIAHWSLADEPPYPDAPPRRR